MNLFNSEQVEILIPKMPRIKQSWERSDNNRYGANRLASTRQQEHKSFQYMMKLKENYFNEIEHFPTTEKELLEACFYLYHLNHYAKAGNPYLYDLKELVLRSFVRSHLNKNNLLKVHFIEGDNKMLLCPNCKAKAEDRNLSYVEYLEKTGGCPACAREYKYYSLYEFIIAYRDYLFCFHTPYKTAKRWFDRTHLPPHKNSPRREGAYAFGRAIYNAEARAVELLEVVQKLQDFLAAYGIKPLIETKRLNAARV